MTDKKIPTDAPAKAPPWNDPKVRALVFQILVVLAVTATGIYLVNNTLTNMESRGISTGFGFLSNESGFNILFSLIDYDATYTYGRTFLVGLLNTILVAILGIIFATIVGFVMGVARLSSNWLISKVALAYIEIFRNIPLLLQIFFWYFAVGLNFPRIQQSIDIGGIAQLNNRGLFLPRPVFEDFFWLTAITFIVAIVASIILAKWAHRRQEKTGQQFPVYRTAAALILGLPVIVYLLSGSPLSWELPVLSGFNFQGGISIPTELYSLLLALVMYTGTFIAETVRSGIQAVAHGQTEAARALGLRETPVLRLIVIPQAMRVIIPPLTSQYLNLTKNSSLAAAIGYPDLVAVFAGTTLNQTGQAVEIIAMTMGVYLLLSLAISLFMNWYNAKMMLMER